MYSNTFDKIQKVVLEAYNKGDHGVEAPNDSHNCGDTLLTFLLVELSEAEDCDTFERAATRLDTAIQQLLEVRKAVEQRILG